MTMMMMMMMMTMTSRPHTGKYWWQRVRITVCVEVVPDEWVVIEHLLFRRDLHHVTQVGFLVARVVARRDVFVNANVAVVLVRAAELVHQLRYVACRTIPNTLTTLRP